MNYTIISLYGIYNKEHEMCLFKFLVDNSHLNKVEENLKKFIDICYKEKEGINTVQELKKLEKESALIEYYLNDYWDKKFYDIVDFYREFEYRIEPLNELLVFGN